MAIYSNGKRTLVVDYDEDSDKPRQQERVGTMLTWERYTSSPDRNPYGSQSDFIESILNDGIRDGSVDADELIKSIHNNEFKETRIYVRDANRYDTYPVGHYYNGDKIVSLAHYSPHLDEKWYPMADWLYDKDGMDRNHLTLWAMQRNATRFPSTITSIARAVSLDPHATSLFNKSNVLLPLFRDVNERGKGYTTSPLKGVKQTQVGFMYMDKDEIASRYPNVRSQEAIRSARKDCMAEVNTYSQWMAGEVYRFRVFDGTRCTAIDGNFYSVDEAIKASNFDIAADGMREFGVGMNHPELSFDIETFMRYNPPLDTKEAVNLRVVGEDMSNMSKEVNVDSTPIASKAPTPHR